RAPRRRPAGRAPRRLPLADLRAGLAGADAHGHPRLSPRGAAPRAGRSTHRSEPAPQREPAARQEPEDPLGAGAAVVAEQGGRREGGRRLEARAHHRRPAAAVRAAGSVTPSTRTNTPCATCRAPTVTARPSR